MTDQVREFLQTQSDRSPKDELPQDFDPTKVNPFVQEPEEDGWALGV